MPIIVQLVKKFLAKRLIIAFTKDRRRYSTRRRWN